MTRPHHYRELTDDQIRQLGDESAAAGDLAQAAICRRAIDELDPESRIDDRAAVEAALAMTVEEARESCARVIADAAAQNDDGGAR